MNTQPKLIKTLLPSSALAQTYSRSHRMSNILIYRQPTRSFEYQL